MAWLAAHVGLACGNQGPASDHPYPVRHSGPEPAVDIASVSSTRPGAYLGVPSSFPRPGVDGDVRVPLALADAEGRVTPAPGEVAAWNGHTLGRLARRLAG